MQTDVLEMVWDALQADLGRVRKQVSGLVTRTERAETAGGVVAVLLVAAPLAISGATSGDLLFLTNVRKVGEGAGAGTGTLCYYNSSTNTWFRVADDTAAVI